MDRSTPEEFKEFIHKFYTTNKREFPWRETRDPYAIMVSEIMLQQTQTSRVIEKYLAWLQIFPTVQALAEAPTAEVLRYWQGLGYNRRALNLQKAAQKIVHDFKGIVPERFDHLLSLPGIGAYTAGAISAFAFNRPVSFIETNIRRVYIYHFFEEDEEVTDKQLMPLIELTVDQENPRDWYYALMDYGSQLAKQVPNPNRRSKHYTKQSVFAGSSRQARGRIVAYLLEKGQASKEVLLTALQLEYDMVDQGLNQLVKEGFIEEDQELYSLK